MREIAAARPRLATSAARSAAQVEITRPEGTSSFQLDTPFPSRISKVQTKKKGKRRVRRGVHAAPG
jgi:hypothetical protein